MARYCLALSTAAILFVLTMTPAARAVPFDGTTQPPSPEAQAMAYLQANQPERAIEVLKKALVTAPNSPRLHYHLGIAYTQTNKLDNAEEEFRTVLREDPDFVEAHLQLASLILRRLSPEQSNEKNLAVVESAVKELDAAVKKNPHDVKLQYQLAETYIQSTRFREKDSEVGFEKGIEVLEGVKKRAPEETGASVALGSAYARQAEFILAGRKISELSGDAAKKANALFDKATGEFSTALSKDPRLLQALANIAAIQRSRGQTEEAIKTLRDHLDKVKEPGEKGICHRWLAQSLVQEGKLDEAEAELNAAIKVDPKEPASHLILADVLVRREMIEKAIDVLKTAVQVDGNFINAHVQLGLLELRRNNVDRAAEYFKSAMGIVPSRARVSPGAVSLQEALGEQYLAAAIQLGEIQMSRSEWDPAVETFRRLMTILPYSPWPEFGMGEVCRRKGEAERARGHYEKALQRDKRFLRARTAMGDMILSGMSPAAGEKERADILRRAIEQYELALAEAPKNIALVDRITGLRIALAAQSKPKDRAVLDKALADVKTAMEAGPGAEPLRLRLAQVHHEMGNDAEAVAELKKVIGTGQEAAAKAPDNVDIAFQLAELRSMLNSWQPDKAVLKQALDGYALVVEKQPQRLQAYRAAGMMLERAKDYPAAVEWWAKLLTTAKGDMSVKALPPDRSDFAFHAAAELAWLYVENLNDLAKAREYAKIATEIRADQPNLIDTVGWIHYKAGEFPEAVAALRRSYKGDPDNATVAYHLGAALVKAGDVSGAKDVLKKALKNVGDDAELKGKIEAALKEAGG